MWLFKYFFQFLKLVNFEKNELSKSEIPFFYEVLKILGLIQNVITTLNEQTEVSTDNIIERIRLHEGFLIFYSKSFDRDVKFIVSNFFRLCESHHSSLIDFRPTTIFRIITSDFLVLLKEWLHFTTSINLNIYFFPLLKNFQIDFNL